MLLEDRPALAAPRRTPLPVARRRLALDPEDRQPEHQQDEEDHDKDVEQDARDVGARSRNAGKAEQASDDRDHQEYQRPFQQRHEFAPTIALSPETFASTLGSAFIRYSSGPRCTNDCCSNGGTCLPATR